MAIEAKQQIHYSAVASVELASEKGEMTPRFNLQMVMEKPGIRKP